jgi:hypothetical protein
MLSRPPSFCERQIGRYGVRYNAPKPVAAIAIAHTKHIAERCTGRMARPTAESRSSGRFE